VGEEGSRAVEGLNAGANAPALRSMEAGIGIIVFLIGATSVFNELQDSLNRIWRAQKVRVGGFFALVRSRLLSFGMILAISFLMMVSLVVSAALSGVGRWWGPLFADWRDFAQAANFILSVGLITVMFALIYKIIPEKRIQWHDVWMGAAMTAMLFTVGKELIGLYLGRSAVASTYGAVGSLAVFLLWVYYSAQIFLLGAEFTRVYSTMRAERAGSAHAGAAAGKVDVLPRTRRSRPIPHRGAIR
jgi:membrane protein